MSPPRRMRPSFLSRAPTARSTTTRAGAREQRQHRPENLGPTWFISPHTHEITAVPGHDRPSSSAALRSSHAVAVMSRTGFRSCRIECVGSCRWISAEPRRAIVAVEQAGHGQANMRARCRHGAVTVVGKIRWSGTRGIRSGGLVFNGRVRGDDGIDDGRSLAAGACGG